MPMSVSGNTLTADSSNVGEESDGYLAWCCTIDPQLLILGTL